MSAEFLSELSELENKIEALLQSLEKAKEQNAALTQSSDLSGSRVSELEGRVSEVEGENKELKKRVEALTADLNEQREKMSTASERVKGLLAKFDAAR